jgi:outer membrane protein assembly factor BamD
MLGLSLQAYCSCDPNDLQRSLGMNLFRITTTTTIATIKILLVSLILIQFVSCSGKDILDSPPDLLYQESEEDIKDEHYLAALEKLRTIKNRHPYSHYAVKAQLRIADVYFLQESYSEAAASYSSFKDLHPKHELMPYVMFKIGESYFKDTPSVAARDLSSAKSAAEAFDAYLKAFPNDKKVDEGKRLYSESREILAAKQLYIGSFYLKRSDLEPAHARFNRVVKEFAETSASKTAAEKISSISPEIESRKLNPPLTERGTERYLIYAEKDGVFKPSEPKSVEN